VLSEIIVCTFRKYSLCFQKIYVVLSEIIVCAFRNYTLCFPKLFFLLSEIICCAFRNCLNKKTNIEKKQIALTKTKKQVRNIKHYMEFHTLTFIIEHVIFDSNSFTVKHKAPYHPWFFSIH